MQKIYLMIISFHKLIMNRKVFLLVILELAVKIINLVKVLIMKLHSSLIQFIKKKIKTILQMFQLIIFKKRSICKAHLMAMQIITKKMMKYEKTG